MKCHFCNSGEIKNVNVNQYDPLGNPMSYDCPSCGFINLTEEAIDLITGGNFTKEEKKIISIVIRNEWETRRRKPSAKALTTNYLDQILKQYRPLDALDRMDKALLNLERASKFIGQKMRINLGHEFPYYHCFYTNELHSILCFLCQEGLIHGVDPKNPHDGLNITSKGYEKLRELKKTGRDSRQCFVAMWLALKLNDIYKKAIEPAIEYIEEGQIEPRFKALKIDDEEHTNDINDEIIAQIRRSRFMVCDLTGYRGGVYWEAGFAYGLGLEVIYTCRKDWIKPEILKDDNGKDVKELLDSKGKRIEIKKEGIHFDLEHRNRIEWEEGDLNLKSFQDKLTKRIKAIII